VVPDAGHGTGVDGDVGVIDEAATWAIGKARAEQADRPFTRLSPCLRHTTRAEAPAVERVRYSSFRGRSKCSISSPIAGASAARFDARRPALPAMSCDR